MHVATRGFFAVAAIVLFTASRPASAQSLADRETARSLMDEGDKKRAVGDMTGALEDYVAADAIMKVPTTGLEVARTYAALGRLLEAREVLQRVLRSPAKAREPAPFSAARRAADAMNAELTTRIPSILVVVSNVDPTMIPEISIDGEPIPPAAATAPRKVNPGTHTVVVRAGAIEETVDVSVAEGEDKTVNIDLKGSAPPAQAPLAPTPAEPARPSGPSSTGKVLAYSGFGVALIGVGVGSVTGVMSLTKTNDLKEVCPNHQCPPGKEAEIDSAKTLGDVATAAFIAGGVGLGVGIVGLLMSGGAQEAAASTAHARRPSTPLAPTSVRAVLGPSYLGVAGTF